MKKTFFIKLIFVGLILCPFIGLKAQTIITHNASMTPSSGVGVACNNKDNRYYREFDLENDFGITTAFSINSVEFAIESLSNIPARRLSSNS